VRVRASLRRVFDYVIVGAGPAGCALANRLSADPGVAVLLVEAGGWDSDPRIAMPMGFGALLGDPAITWRFPTRQGEQWVRGRTLGGSSAINGMVYNRGQPADYDALGLPGWTWEELLPAFRAIEERMVGAHAGEDPLLEDVIAAGGKLGWRRVCDVNESDGERIGYASATIRDGRRVTAADAFLHPVLDRPNLTLALNAVVDRVVFDGRRAVGVRGGGFEFAAREVVLAAGAIATPRILQLSGVGPWEVLRAAGVDVVADSPHVGARMREHRVFMLQFRLAEDLGYNRLISSGAAQREYERSRRGPLAAPASDLVAFFKTRPELDRPDAQIQIAPYSFEHEPGMLCLGFGLRPDSEGSIRITSADADAPLDIDPGHLGTEHDRAVAVGVVHAMRRLFATEPLASRIARETVSGEGPGYHAIGTCAMGVGDDDVVDARLRVRGVSHLRVVDASVLPRMVAGNLAGPVAALGWRAAEVILEEAVGSSVV